MIAPSEKRTTIKFNWYRKDNNWFYYWNRKITINFDFGKSEMRIELKNKNFGGDYTIEKQISKNDTFTTFLVHKKQNGSAVNFKIKLFQNHKKVIVESENSDKILFINGEVIYDGMKFYRFFEEENDNNSYNENLERETRRNNIINERRKKLEDNLKNYEKLSDEEIIKLLKKVEPEIVELLPNNILFYWFVANNFKYYLNNKVGLLLFNPITEAEELELKNYKSPTNEAEDFRYNYLKTKSLDTYLYNESKIGNKFLKEVVKQFKTENPDWRKSLPKDDVLFYKRHNCKTLEQQNRYYYCYVYHFLKIEPIDKLKWIINNHKDFKEKTVDELINFIKISDDEFQETLHLARKAIPLTEKEIERFSYLEGYVQDSLNFIKKLNLKSYFSTTYTVEKIVAEIKGEISPLTNYITEFRENYKKYCERQQEKKAIFLKDENIKPVNINVVKPESIKNIDEIKNNLDKFIFDNKSILNVYNYIVKNDIDIDVIKKICNSYLKEMPQFFNINSSNTLVNRFVSDMNWWTNSIDQYKGFKKSGYDILRFEIKGAFTEECKKNLSKCDVYDTLILLDEEYNIHDKNAISVNFEDEFECFIKIGYVPKELTSKVRNIEKNSPLTFIFITKKVISQRVYVEAEMLYQIKPWSLD